MFGSFHWKLFWTDGRVMHFLREVNLRDRRLPNFPLENYNWSVYLARALAHQKCIWFLIGFCGKARPSAVCLHGKKQQRGSFIINDKNNSWKGKKRRKKVRVVFHNCKTMSTEEVSLKIRAGKPFFFCISVPRIKVQRGEGEEKPFFEAQKKDLSFFLLFGWNGADAAGRERSRIFIEICGRGRRLEMQ